MVESNQNKNLKQANLPSAVRKLYFTVNKKSKAHPAQLFTFVLQNRCTKSIKIAEKGVKLGSFLQCSAHIFLRHDGCF